MRFDVLREHKEGAFWQYTPDNQEFVGLAKLYAKKHSAMSTVSENCPFLDFDCLCCRIGKDASMKLISLRMELQMVLTGRILIKIKDQIILSSKVFR